VRASHPLRACALLVGVLAAGTVVAITLSGKSSPARAPFTDGPAITGRAPEAVAASDRAAPVKPARVASRGSLQADSPAHPGDLRRTTGALLKKLSSSDPFDVLDAADGLAARKVTAAIPTLAALDLPNTPDSAPSVIDALGRLAGEAAPEERAVATDRLLELLALEKRRRAPESAANQLALYEALGFTRDPRAVPGLEAELRDRSVGFAARTIVIESLVRLGQPSSRAAALAAREELERTRAAEAFEEDVRGELAASLDRALAALP
jgi:hypothetical protein